MFALYEYLQKYDVKYANQHNNISSVCLRLSALFEIALVFSTFFVPFAPPEAFDKRYYIMRSKKSKGKTLCYFVRLLLFSEVVSFIF